MVPRQVESEVLEHLCMNVTDKSEAFCKTCEERKEMGIKIPLQSTQRSFGTKLCNICKLSDIKNQQNLLLVEP